MDSSKNTPTVTIEAVCRIARHEAERSLAKYTKTALTGFVILASAVSYVIHDTATTAADNDRELAQNRVTAVRLSCAADKQFSEALRAALNGQIAFIREADEPAPPTTEQRVASIERLKAQIPLPDCESRVRQVQDANDE